VPSAESFSLLAQFQPTTSDAYKAYIQDALVSYNQSSLIGILKNVVRSNNKVVVLKALDIVFKGLTDIKNGQTSQVVDGRNRRETTYDDYSVKNYQLLLPALLALNSQDAEIQASLQQTIALIESTTAVASN
jgi:hypothetical protein